MLFLDTYKLEEVVVNNDSNEITAYFTVGSDEKVTNTLRLVYNSTTEIEEINPADVQIEISPTVDRGKYLEDTGYKLYDLNEFMKTYLTNIVKLRGNVDYNKITVGLLDLTEFSILRMKEGYVLYDEQREETLDDDITSGLSLFDSLETYIEDYIVEPIEKCQNVSLYGTLQENLNQLLKENKLIINWDVQVLDMVCNFPEKVNIDTVYGLLIGDEEGYNRSMADILECCNLTLIHKSDRYGKICYGLSDNNDFIKGLRMESYHHSEEICERIESLMYDHVVSNLEENYGVRAENFQRDFEEVKADHPNALQENKWVRLTDFYLYHANEADLYKVYLIQEERNL